MHKYVYQILQEFSVQRPPSRHKSTSCQPTKSEKEAAKILLSPNDKRLKSYVLMKLNQIQEDKQIFLTKKRKALHWYKIILDKMVSPFIEYLPGVTTSYNLSKLTDFRTHGVTAEQSQEASKKKMVVRSKCVEEPLPILIKPEYKVLKCCKKEWKIMNKLAIAKETKNEMIKKYKNWKSKIKKEPGKQKETWKKQSLLVYDLFIRDAIESKIENLMPSIKSKNEHSNVYDLRFRNEPELEQYDHQLTSCNPSPKYGSKKVTNRSKTFITKPQNNKGNNTITVKPKTSHYETPTLKKEVKVLNSVKKHVQKEETQTKPSLQRPLYKQNRTKGDTRMKTAVQLTENIKSESIKLNTLSNNKDSTIQPTIIAKQSDESKASSIAAAIVRQNVEETENKSEIFTPKENSLGSLVVNEKFNDSALLPDIMYKPTENPLRATMTTNIGVTDKSEKCLGLDIKESRAEDPLQTYSSDCKVESATVSVDTSASLDALKLDTTLDVPNKSITSALKSYTSVRAAQGIDNNKTESQNEIKINYNLSLPQSKSENLNKTCLNLSDGKLIDDSREEKSLVLVTKPGGEKKTVDSRELKNTYLVSFKVDDEEAFLKTRSQVVSDEIKGDLIDLNVILEEEKKVREGKNRTLSDIKNTTGNTDTLSYTNKSESQSQLKTNVQNTEQSKTNVTSVAAINVSTEPLNNNLTKSKNVISQQSNSDCGTNEVTETINNHIVSNKNLSDAEITAFQSKKDNKNCDIGHNKTGLASCEKHNEQKQAMAKTPQAIELTGLQKKDKKLKHKKITVEKEKNILRSKADKSKKYVKQAKKFDQNKRYQEIINSVKRIIPSGNSNENLFEKNTTNILHTGSDIKNNYGAPITKTYTKTINELKEIILELPGSDSEQVIKAEKCKHHTEAESKGNKTSTTYLKTTGEKNIFTKGEKVDSNPTETKSNSKTKRINLKKIKIVENITNKIVKTQNALNFNKIGATMTADKRKEDSKNNLELSKSKLVPNKRQHKTGFQINYKENNKENNNLTANRDRINPLKQHKQPSNPLDKNVPLSPLKEERTRAKSASNIKVNERKAEENKEPKLNIVPRKTKSNEVKINPYTTGAKNTPLKNLNKSVRGNLIKGQHLVKIDEKKNTVNPSKDDNYNHSDEQRGSSQLSKSADSILPLIKEEGVHNKGKGLNTNKIETYKIKATTRSNSSSEGVKPREVKKGLSLTGIETPIREVENEDSAEMLAKKSKSHTSTENKTSDSIEVPNKLKSSENEKLRFAMEKIVKSAENSVVQQRRIIKFTRKSEMTSKKGIKNGNDFIKTGYKSIMGVNSKADKSKDVDNISKTSESSKSLQTSSSTLESKIQNNESKVERKEAEPTGILPRKTLKVKMLSNKNPKINPQLFTSDEKTFPKNSEQSRRVSRTDELFNVHKRLENTPLSKDLKKVITNKQ